MRAALNVRFREGALPHVLFTDRGAGFYNPGNGRVTDEYRAALAEHGLQAFMGDSAAVQPGRLSDLMLHETAVSWIRSLLAITLPARPWQESPQQLIARLKRVAGKVNADYDVAGLCRELPARVEELVRRGGGKRRKSTAWWSAAPHAFSAASCTRSGAAASRQADTMRQSHLSMQTSN